MDRATVSSWTPVEIAERDSDLGELYDAADSDDLTQQHDLILNPASLKDFLEDEELAGPLSGIVGQLQPCIDELAAQMGRTHLPEIQRMLTHASALERQLLAFVTEAA